MNGEMKNDAAVKIRGLEKRFPGFKLGPVDLTVPKGAIYGLIGPNGAGKTTTMDLMLGMGRGEAGRIEIFGMDHQKDEVAVKARIGYVSPELNFAPWGNVRKLINFYRGFYPDWDDEYCAQLMLKMQIGAEEKIATLSFGSRTKLGVILALSHRPDLLLLDEPTVGVDAAVKRDIFAELLEAVQSPERSVMISSHGMADLERFCDHIGMLKEGRMLFEGGTSDLVTRFQRVEYTLPAGLNRYDGPADYYLEKEEKGRVSAIADTSDGAIEAIRAMGAEEVAVSPISLEDLFVAAARSWR